MKRDMEMRIRQATEGDIPVLRALIDASVRGLQVGDYSATQIDHALKTVFGVDSQLIADGTYFVVEARVSAADGKGESCEAEESWSDGRSQSQGQTQEKQSQRKAPPSYPEGGAPESQGQTQEQKQSQRKDPPSYPEGGAPESQKRGTPESQKREAHESQRRGAPESQKREAGIEYGKELVIAGCGGWSRRKKLHGGDAWTEQRLELLDPALDAAKIRAFFIAPAFARMGVGTRILEACEAAAFAAGFRRFEMSATLTGVKLFGVRGYMEMERTALDIGGGERLPVVRMEKRVFSGAGVVES